MQRPACNINQNPPRCPQNLVGTRNKFSNVTPRTSQKSNKSTFVALLRLNPRFGGFHLLSPFLERLACGVLTAPNAHLTANFFNHLSNSLANRELWTLAP